MGGFGGTVGPPGGPPGPEVLPSELLDRLGDLATELEEASGRVGWWRASTAELGQALEALDGVRRVVDILRSGVVGQVAERGLHSDAGFSLVDYLGIRSRWVPRDELVALARTAQRLREPKNAAVARAVATGDLSVERADVLLRALARVNPYVDVGTYLGHAELLLPLARMGADKELRTATEHLVALATPEKSAEELAKARQESCKVFESSLSGGMRRFIIEADPEGAALLDAVFTSVLTKPIPGPGGQPDERSAGQRRYDALLSVLSRGVSHPEGVPTTSKVSILVMLDWDILAEATGAVAQTLGGKGSAFFTAGQVRAMACTAGIIPAVLGGDSQVLDHGQNRRLATPAQLRILYRRDGGCTFPGCSMPAMWTEAHHADVWWSEGGRTDILSMALLCRRHHRWVHAWDPEVTITGHGVTWHLDRLHGNGVARASLHTDTDCTDHGGDHQQVPRHPEDLPPQDPDDSGMAHWQDLFGGCETGTTGDASVDVRPGSRRTGDHATAPGGRTPRHRAGPPAGRRRRAGDSAGSRVDRCVTPRARGGHYATDQDFELPTGRADATIGPTHDHGPPYPAGGADPRASGQRAHPRPPSRGAPTTRHSDRDRASRAERHSAPARAPPTSGPARARDGCR